MRCVTIDHTNGLSSMNKSAMSKLITKTKWPYSHVYSFSFKSITMSYAFKVK